MTEKAAVKKTATSESCVITGDIIYKKLIQASSKTRMGEPSAPRTLNFHSELSCFRSALTSVIIVLLVNIISGTNAQTTSVDIFNTNNVSMLQWTSI